MPYITIDDKKTVVTTVCIDGEMPPPHIQIDIQDLLEKRIQDILEEPRTKKRVTMRTLKPSRTYALGFKDVNIIKVFVDTDMETVPVGIKNKIGSTVKSELERLNFNVTEVETVIE